MIIFIGVAGVGKSLQGQLVAKNLDCDWISVGHLLREEPKYLQDPRMQTGELLSDEETIEIVQKNIEKYGTNTEFVLDGFPRTVPQAEWLVSQVKSGKYKITLIVNLQASFNVVRERLLKRGREDDKAEIIEKRFDEFEKKTKPLLQIYKNSNLPLVNIDADRTPEEVHADIIKYLV